MILPGKSTARTPGHVLFAENPAPARVYLRPIAVPERPFQRRQMTGRTPEIGVMKGNPENFSEKARPKSKIRFSSDISDLVFFSNFTAALETRRPQGFMTGSASRDGLRSVEITALPVDGPILFLQDFLLALPPVSRRNIRASAPPSWRRALKTSWGDNP
ncbi:MAG: hypothetical protein H2040_09595 [Euryhalocaulis sp.]|uniref:hypothetical protein n=1 Tax=Euryhalocaulis sp. TaxID=2744307 RepID=UPI001830263D|nr:hypothetical protein [Euryhalocaulis sp.]MBA4802105.1 hypothetical protein [Euryhalocaulis sp.]